MSAKSMRHVSIPRRWALAIGASVAVLLLCILIVRVTVTPEYLAGLLLRQVGNALNLEIAAHGKIDYQLRPTPTLVVRKIDAREPGASVPLLKAETILLSLPWSTIRSRGDDLKITRIEMDTPILNVAALQHWLQTRPPSQAPRIPTLTKGVSVKDGRIDFGDWQIDQFSFDLPQLRPHQPVNARAQGRYVDAAIHIHIAFNLSIALTQPENGAGAAVVGPLQIGRGDWRLPARIRASAPIRFQDNGISLRPMRIALAARYPMGAATLPFALAFSGHLNYQDALLRFAPVGVALRSDASIPGNAIPNIDANGAIASKHKLAIRLSGKIARWPVAWPALPTPLNTSKSPLPFLLRYTGSANFSDSTQLKISRDDVIFDGHFRLFELFGWTDSKDRATPLPPLSGRLTVPAVEISGMRLKGVEISLDDTESP